MRNGKFPILFLLLRIGSVDIIRIKKEQNIVELIEKIISNMYNIIEKLYNTGAKNFLILNIL